MFDAYNLRARLAPVGLAALPAIVLCGGGLVSPSKLGSVAAMAFGGVGVVLAGMAREAGRRQQDHLWRAWGGSPTLQQLRWRPARDREKLGRQHAALAQLAGFELPTEAQEARDPAAADERYNEATELLRNVTRKRDEFPLVFAENVEYGFRRNCLGLGPVALLIAMTVFAVAVVLALAGSSQFWVPAVVGLLAAVWWKFVVSAEWVQPSAELYAQELLGAIPVVVRRDTAKPSDS